MTDNNAQINLLLQKLEILMRKQEGFSNEISVLRDEINSLRGAPANAIEEELRIPEQEPVIVEERGVIEEQKTVQEIYLERKEKMAQELAERRLVSQRSTLPKGKSNLEKFIGENLINKIGIIITVIGVAIGAKYTIEHDLISPMTRIILGYLVGLGLLGFGIKLKKKFESYSAVLVSGAMAIMYFITYAAYSFYDLIPQSFAFVLMALFTAFTVVAAINYNRQVIAHIGLVGAYAVPFLLSDGSGKIAIMFTYMAIINCGILVIAFKRYWKSLYYAAFGLTWIIYTAWYVDKYNAAIHFGLAMTFLFIFFAIFYSIFLAYKLLKKEKFEMLDIVMLLTNSFIFYGLGYALISSQTNGDEALGLFTLFNAFIHFGVCAFVYQKKLVDQNVFFLIAGLVLIFITITIPVQLDGNWVTLFWACEAALLFWIGRTKQVPIYEKLSYPVMALAFFSLVEDWFSIYSFNFYQADLIKFKPIFNIHFLTSFLFIAAFAFINYVHKSKNYTSPLVNKGILKTIVSIAIPSILLLVIYAAFRFEIEHYWNLQYAHSIKLVNPKGFDYSGDLGNADLTNFRMVWVYNYSFLFLILLSFVNIRKFLNRNLGLLTIGLNLVGIVLFLFQGLPALDQLKDAYLNHSDKAIFQVSAFHIGIRYISFALVGLMLFSLYKYLQQVFMQPLYAKTNIAFDILLHGTIVCIASYELMLWLEVINPASMHKLGLSILWGTYSLLLIILGIWKKKAHLRIGAIVLFGITLIKLFFYDISDLDTIAKTIVFVALGVLLLIISFLYNKYKHLIAKENEN
jgi:uncharacterized membrane protein